MREQNASLPWGSGNKGGREGGRREKKKTIKTELGEKERKEEEVKKERGGVGDEAAKERRKKRERGSQAVVESCQPSVWSMRSSLEEASQAREGHTHTHIYIHNNSQRRYIY